jgi:hypothetical protein
MIDRAQTAHAETPAPDVHSDGAATSRHRRKSGTPEDRTPATAPSMHGEESPKFVIWIPAIEPRRRVEHCVTFSQVAATVQARDAIYTSLCEIRFTPAAPMTAPPWPHCPRCTLFHQQWTENWRKTQDQSRRKWPFRLVPRRQT